jgi:hypothetical protein
MRIPGFAKGRKGGRRKGERRKREASEGTDRQENEKEYSSFPRCSAVNSPLSGNRLHYTLLTINHQGLGHAPINVAMRAIWINTRSIPSPSASEFAPAGSLALLLVLVLVMDSQWAHHVHAAVANREVREGSASGRDAWGAGSAAAAAAAA